PWSTKDTPISFRFSPSLVPVRNRCKRKPGNFFWRTIRGGLNRESMTLTVIVLVVVSRLTTIPSSTGVPSTSATCHVTISGATFARWIQTGGGVEVGLSAASSVASTSTDVIIRLGQDKHLFVLKAKRDGGTTADAIESAYADTVPELDDWLPVY